MMIRQIAMILGLVLLILSEAGAEVLVYKDKLGRDVSVAAPVKRAVIFQTYELIPALGIWDRIAGIGRYAYKNDLMLASRPDIGKTIPSVGGGMDVNMEALLKLKPDIVITWTARPENIRFMEQQGLRVVSIYPESIAELYGVMEFFGGIFDKKKEMRRTIAGMEHIFSDVRKRVGNIPANQKQKVLWLGSRQNAVACRTGVTNDMIAMIGGINPAAAIDQRNADVSVETLVKWNPDVIFIWGNAVYGARDILNNPQLQCLKAVRTGRVYKAPAWSTWSPRLAPVVLWMAMKTYPDRFADVHLETVCDGFYKKTFGIPYRMVAGIEP
ncbi:MAG: ABC transporter substrate-binding protein [Deltaproteobacteria bacterium]|nr:ABC transporter substrate-binding protein [Deltaproteobacteria bacterium]